MSLRAMVWALEQDMFSATQKFVLVVYANFASETGMAYPSVETVANMTGHKVETVRRAVAGLAKDGFLVDTGKRAGATQRVRVYQFPEPARDLNVPEMGGIKYTPKSPPIYTPKCTRNGGVIRRTDEPMNQKTAPSGDSGPALKEFPKELNTARIQNKWQVWMTVRRGMRNKPKNWVILFNEQIEMLSSYTEPEAFEILSASIRGNWQGLFPPKPQHAPSPANGNHYHKPPVVDWGTAELRKLGVKI